MRIKKHCFIQSINQSINQSISINQNNVFSNIIKWGDLDLFLVYFMILCLTATTQLPDTQNLWHCTLTLSIRKIHNFWSSSFLVFLVTTMRNWYSRNGVTWSYTGLEAHFTFFILWFFLSYFTAFKAWKIRQNSFPAICTFKLHKKLLISLFKQRRG